ncbi:hypothetical protein QJQ45_029297 [Haematococcus lacustris]|nr:hypothetical protein QJQ45_029297 [Haematococcus lacustris]
MNGTLWHSGNWPHSTAECHLLKQQQPQAAPAPTPAHPHSHGAAASSQPIDPDLYEQFRLFMASRSPAAAPPLRAHTVVQSRSGPSRGRPRCDHCGKDGHTEERCFSKHPELRPAQWGQPGPAHSLAAVPGVGEGEDEDEDEDAALNSLTNMPITSVSTAFDAMRHAIALAAAAERPLSFMPGGATTHALPASRVAPRDTSSSSSSSSSSTKVPMQLEGQADITDTVRTLVQQVSTLQQNLLAMEAHMAQLRAERPLAQAVASATGTAAQQPIPVPQSAALAAAGPAQPASSLRALPFAANPSVCAGLSVLDRHGTPHALPGVMLDSGSGAQLITASLARQLKLEVLPSQQRIIQSGGTAFQTQGAAVVEVGLALGTPYAARSRHRFQVVADSTSLPYDLLVGNEILFRHGIQLDLVGRLLSYAPRLFSHNEAQPRHALPMYFEPPAEWSSGQLLSQSSVIATSLVASPDPVTNAHPTPPAQLSALQPYTQDAVSESGSSGYAESSAAAPVTEAGTGPSNWAAIPAAYPASLMSYALPYAANLSVATGLSIIDRHGHPHAVPGVVLDSGSGAHLIAPWLVERLELQADHMRLRIFQSGGTAFHAHGGVMAEVGLALGTPHAAKSRHRFHVMPAACQLPFSLLLGTEALYQHGIQLDLTAQQITYAPSLASHGRLQPRHALPLRFNARDAWPGLSSMVETSLVALPEPTSPEPLWSCVTSPAHSEGEHGSSGHTGVSYLGAPGAQSSAISAAPGCSHAPSVAEDTPRPEIRGLVWEPRSKPGHGTDRPQLPARSPKHQALGLGAARRRAWQQLRTTPPPKGTSWATAGHQLLTTIRKGCTLRTITTLLLILCALLPTLHACPPNELPAVPALPDAYCSVTIEHTLPGGRQHLPPDVRFTKHAKGMLFGNHPGMTTAEHAALQALVEDHDSAFSYSMSDLPGYHGPRPPFSIPLTSDQPVRTPPRRYSPLERQVCIDKTAELQAAGIVSPVEGPCSYAAAPVLPAKKDAHGNWTEKRFAIDYHCTNRGTTALEVQRRTQAVATQPAATPLHEVFTTKPGRDRAAAAQRLHGRVVRHTGTGLWGVLRFKGQQFHPRFFAVDWVDGTITDAMSPTILRNRQWLQPEGTTLPAAPPHGVQPSRRRSTRLGPSGDNAVLATMATVSTGLISMASLSRRTQPGPARAAKPQTTLLQVTSHAYNATCCTRPDIAYAVGALARHMAAPTQQHWTAAKAVLSYLKGTASQGLVFGGNDSLQGYCDADYAGDKDTARSTTGYVFTLHGAAISWSSRLQPTVAMSTAEAEYMAASGAVKEAVWLRKLMQDLGLPGTCVNIMCDNQAALQLLNNPMASARSKHISVNHHFARERAARGEVMFTYCSTLEMVADVMTKPLAAVKLGYAKEGCGISSM